MNEKVTKICRLCLSECNSNFEVTDEVTKQLLDGLMLNINLFITQETVMCKNCSENIRKSFNFKSVFLETENYINSFIKQSESTKVDLQEVYLSRILNTGSVSYNSKVCRICLKLVGSFSHNVKNAVLKEMLKKCFPELDLNSTEDAVVCNSCSELLENYFTLITTCFEVEEKIKIYCKIVGTNSEYIDLGGVLQFTLKNNVKHNDCYDNLERIKIEEDTFGKEENICGEQTEEQKINIKSEEFVIKPQQHDFDSFDNCTQYYDGAEVYRCAICEYSTEYKTDLDRHILNHKKQSTISSSKSEHGYVLPTTPNKGDNKTHNKKKISTETTLYTCNICSHKTKYKSNFRDHILIHKTTSEVPTYKCQICIYQTKHRAYLNKHMLIHKSLSEVTVYKCATCPYQTKDKRNLKLHVLIHRSPSQLVMYKCDICTYQSKHKSGLKTHMVTHKNSSEVTMYQCPTCVHQTKHKSALAHHMLTHNTASKMIVYKCSACAYQTKNKWYLKTHFLIHKDPSEMVMYECKDCAYRTPNKYRFKSHMMNHKNPAGVMMHNCEVCKYQTMYKSNLKKHMVIHRDPSELPTYTCDVCSYQTKRQRYLKKHMEIHQSPSEASFFRCYLCAYKCKQKHSIRSHVLIHRAS